MCRLNLNQYTDYGFTQTEILRLKEAFDLFDIEEKGILDINTLQKSLNELGIMSKNKDLQNLDMEGKKEIDFNTFVELFGARPVCRTEEEAKNAFLESLTMTFEKNTFDIKAPHFVMWIVSLLEQQYDQETLKN